MPYYYQDGAEWCWAASSSMMAKYYNADWPGFIPIKPWAAAALLRKGPEQGGNLIDVEVTLLAMDPYRAYTITPLFPGWLSLATFLPKLTLGHPVMVLDHKHQHGFVVTGYDLATATVSVNDPSGGFFEEPGGEGCHFQVTWDEFFRKVNALIPVVDGLLVYAQQADFGVPWMPLQAHKASFDLIPGSVLAAFQQPPLPHENILEIAWDGKSHGGYYYGTTTGIDPSNHTASTLFGYKFLCSDVIQFSPYITDYSPNDLDCLVELTLSSGGAALWASSTNRSLSCFSHVSAETLFEVPVSAFCGQLTQELCTAKLVLKTRNAGTMDAFVKDDEVSVDLLIAPGGAGVETNLPITSPPVVSIVAITPSSAVQGPTPITFTGEGDDPDTVGAAPEIRGYRWTSDRGTTDGRTQLYPTEPETFGPVPSFQLLASQLRTGTHRIRLQVKDNDNGGEISDFAEATLEVLAGSTSSILIIHSPTTASPVSLLPGGFFSADVEWDLTGVPGFDASVGVVVLVGHETSPGSFRTTETGPYHEAHRREVHSSLSTSPGSYRGLRDVLVKVIHAGSRQILAEAVMPDALNFTSQQPQNMTLGISPNSTTIDPGASGQFTITVNGQNGFNQAVSLAVVGGLTEGVSANFSPNPVSPGQSSTLTLNVSSSSPPGTYFVAVQGTGGGVTATASGKYIIPGPNLVLEFRDASQVEGTSLARIDCTLTGSKPSYYHMEWEYLKPGNAWTPLNASSISGPNPVTPGQFSLTWDTSSATDLNGFDGNVLFRMRTSSNPNGQLDLLQSVSLPVSKVWGITWTGSRFLITSGDGTGRRQIHELNTSFSITGGPWNLPFGSHNWAVTWNNAESRLYVFDGNQPENGYKLKADFTPEWRCSWNGPAAYGAFWGNPDEDTASFFWLVEGGVLTKGCFYYNAPASRWEFRLANPGQFSLPIAQMSGVAYDGSCMYASSMTEAKLLQFRQRSGFDPAVIEVFSTSQFGDGTFQDVVFGNGALWAIGSFGDRVYRVGVPEKFKSGGVGIGLDNNAVPAEAQLNAPSGVVSDDVQIAYQLGDPEGDTLSIALEYSIDSGTNWIAAATFGSTSDITVARYNGSCVWRSALNLPDFEGAASLRMRSNDRDPGPYSSEIIVNLRNRPPSLPRSPDTPVNLYPYAGQVGVLPNPILIASAFSDADADSQFSRSRFQVVAAEGGFTTPLWDSGELSPPANSVEVPVGILQTNFSYLWRAAYRDDSGLWSAWSAETAFTLGTNTLCTYGFTMSPLSFGTNGGGGTFGVTASESSRAWSINCTSSWLRFNVTSGIGPSNGTFTVDAHSGSLSRTGVVVFVGSGGSTQPYTVSQAGSALSGLRVESSRLVGNTFTVSVLTQAGVMYILEFKNSLSDALWIPVETVAGTGAWMTFTDTAATAPTRFYRVRAMSGPADFVWIPAGSFIMGSPDSEQERNPNEGPQTQVTFSKGFWMATHEVTQAEYLAVMGTNPSSATDDVQCPVTGMEWSGATNYCATLTDRERLAGRLPTGYVYRLPTEAEWEYACRSGTTSRYSYGDDLNYTNYLQYAWFFENGGGHSHPVGALLSNAWGLYDLHGNVWEWCLDWLGPYPGGSVVDPTGFPVGSERVLRGSSWDNLGKYGRCATRGSSGPTDRRWHIGFRGVVAPVLP